MRTKSIVIIVFLFCFSVFFAQQKTVLKTYSFEEAEKLQKANPNKKIMVFLHTDWCKYCKKMEATTFSDPEIVEKINQKVIFVSLNPENHKEDIVFGGRKFKFKKLSSQKGIHEIAEHLVGLGKRIDYPTIVLLNNNNEVVFRIGSYLNPKQMNKILDKL